MKGVRVKDLSKVARRKRELLRAQARAWDRGYIKAVSDYEEDVPVSVNPYREKLAK